MFWQRVRSVTYTRGLMSSVSPLKIYWIGAGTLSSVCLYDFSVDFLTKGDCGKNFCNRRQNIVIRGLAIPLSMAVGFTIGPVVAPPIILALL